MRRGRMRAHNPNCSAAALAGELLASTASSQHAMAPTRTYLARGLFILLAALGLEAGSILARAQNNGQCLACHQDPNLAATRAGRKISLYVDASTLARSPHRDLQCVMCHSGFDANKIPHAKPIQPVACLDCHSDAASRHTVHRNLIFTGATSADKSAGCKQCHGTHDVNVNVGKGCAVCHSEAAASFQASAHGQAVAAGVSAAPSCLTCHAANLVPSPNGSDLLRIKQAQTAKCLSCHLDNPQVRARTTPTAGFIAAYETSVHGRALANGNAQAANCVDCHGAHNMRKGTDPASRLSKQNTADTCGKCHAQIAQEYKASIHGTAIAKGSRDAPTCTDCHGEHSILPPSNPRSPVAPRNVAEEVCATCHSSVRLAERYGFPSDRFQTFEDSYHGLAMRNGATNVANCASCHGVHNILPSSDPRSTVNKANLVRTCGKCHPGANARFVQGRVHVQVTEHKAPVLYWISTLYLALIASVIGGMFLHNVADFIRKAKVHLGRRRGVLPRLNTGHGLYLRMTLNERLQHGVLMISFITLALTGFMLVYPDAWWVDWTRRVLGHVYQLRGTIHRAAGATLLLAGIYHIFYLSATQRGRELFRDLLPRRQDFLDAFAMAKYNLGLSPHRPPLDRFSYIEKSEYWALVWGTVIMGGTGIIMWFEDFFLRYVTKLGWDVSSTIHFYEAWMAVLAILVWHMYFVIFNPDVYPMNLAWLRGTISEEEMAEEHPLELERLKGRRATPPSP